MLSWISTEFFARSPVLVFPLIALGIFMTVFIAAAVRAARTDSERLDELARLPFDDSEVGSHD
ncbi:MAG: hypothetical protein OXU20_00205 [Myxococcales bacterium]|nr:hypothetical protein [Myxococcales bacterium]MDD9969861.1 hypothetical protein [Myxococcales bacterium]